MNRGILELQLHAGRFLRVLQSSDVEQVFRESFMLMKSLSGSSNRRFSRNPLGKGSNYCDIGFTPG